MTLPLVYGNGLERFPEGYPSPTAVSWMEALQDSPYTVPAAGTHCYILAIGKDLTDITSQVGMAVIDSGVSGGSKWWLFHKVADGTEGTFWFFDFTTSGTSAHALVGLCVLGSALDVVGAVHTNTGDDCYADAVATPPGNVMAGYLWAGTFIATPSDAEWSPSPAAVTLRLRQAADFPSPRPWGVTNAYLDNPPTPSPQVIAPTPDHGDDNVGVQILFSDVPAPAVLVGWVIGRVAMIV